jgi:hypothetical protein
MSVPLASWEKRRWTRVGIGGHLTPPTLTEITASILRRAPVARTYTHPTSGLGATTLLCNDKRILRPSLDFCSTSGMTTLWSPQAVIFQHWKTRAVVIKSRHTGVVRANLTLTQLRGGLRQQVAIYGSEEGALFHMQGDWS